MAKTFESARATVLDKCVRGENVLYLRVFCAECGLALFLKKISSKKTQDLPDYFDDISIAADYAKTGDLKFLRSHELLVSRAQIAKDYDAFSHASAIAECILKNGAEIENTSRIDARMRAAFNAIARGAPPSIVRLKFMFLFAREEGYPVLQDFYAKLSPENNRFFTALIRTPADELTDFRSRADDILEKLCDWIYTNTDIIK